LTARRASARPYKVWKQPKGGKLLPNGKKSQRFRYEQFRIKTEAMAYAIEQENVQRGRGIALDTRKTFDDG
jgi:hypothetical protein